MAATMSASESRKLRRMTAAARLTGVAGSAGRGRFAKVISSILLDLPSCGTAAERIAATSSSVGGKPSRLRYLRGFQKLSRAAALLHSGGRFRAEPITEREQR